MINPTFDKDKIGEALTKKKAFAPCNRCQKKEFAILDGFAKTPMHETHDIKDLPMHYLPTVVLGCTNCGAIVHHSFYMLFPEEK